MAIFDVGWLLLVSVAGFAMAPLWARWWDAALRRSGLSRPRRVAGVLALSIATLLATFVGPWLLMAILYGTPDADLADPRLPIGMLFLFGPGVAIQVFWALNVAMRCDGNSS
jgi:hypothetical protein